MAPSCGDGSRGRAAAPERRARWRDTLPWLAVAAILSGAQAAPAQGAGADDPALRSAIVQQFVEAVDLGRRAAAPEASRDDVLAFLSAMVAFEALDPAYMNSFEGRTYLWRTACDSTRRLASEEAEQWLPWIAERWVAGCDALDEPAASREALAAVIERSPGARPWTAYLRTDLADRERRVGSWSAAEVQLCAAEAILLELRQGGLDDPASWRNLAGVRFQLALDLGLLDEAAAWLERQREWAAELARQGELDLATRLSIDLAQANLDIASVRLEAVVARLTPLVDPSGPYADAPEARARLLVRLGLAHAELESLDAERPRAARSVLESALLVDGLESGDRRIALEASIDVAFHGGELGRVEELLASVHRDGGADASSALAVEERAFLAASRARLALARGAPEPELRNHDEALHSVYGSLLAAWASAPESPSGLGILLNSTRRLLFDQLIAIDLRLDGRDAGLSRAFEDVTRWEVQGTLAQRIGAPPPTLALVRRELLAAGEGLLLYFPGDDITHLFVIDGSSARHRSLASKYLLAGQVLALQRALSRPPGAVTPEERERALAEVSSVAAELGEQLLPADVRRAIRDWSAVTIVGADLLGGVPFELLPCDGVALGIAKPVTHLATCALGLGLARRAKQVRVRMDGAEEILVVTSPLAVANRASVPANASTPVSASAPSKARPLVLGAEDLEDLLAPLGERRVRVLRQAEADRTHVAAALERRPYMLHFLTHGTYDPMRPRPAALVLSPGAADDGRLFGEEIEAELVAPELVILSACGAARGSARLGDDGVTSLGGAFLSAGARCVILSRYDLELDATLLLTRSLFARLHAGDSPAEALRAARAELSTDPRFAHPFFHAGVQAVGLGGGPVLPPR